MRALWSDRPHCSFLNKNRLETDWFPWDIAKGGGERIVRFWAPFCPYTSQAHEAQFAKKGCCSSGTLNSNDSRESGDSRESANRFARIRPPKIQYFFGNLQRIAKRAGGKGSRQKTSKIVKKCQKVFRHFSTIFAQGQKTSKIVKKCHKYFRHFSRDTIFPAPFGGL